MRRSRAVIRGTAVKHDESIAVLLARALGRSTDQLPAPEVRQAALEHAARCSDCYTVLRLAHELATGAPPPNADRMPGLFGCDDVRDRLYLLADTPIASLRRTDQPFARHLAWCLACLERAAEVLAVEAEAAGLTYGPPLLAPAAARWQDAATRAGESVREVVGRVVIRVRRAAAAFAAVPDGFLVSPLPAPAAAVRGDAPEAPLPGAPALGRQVQFALPDAGLWAELTLEPQGDDLVGLALQLTAPDDAALSVHVRDRATPEPQLVARHTVRGAEPIHVRGLRPGQYLLELHDRRLARCFTLPFDVERPV
jgi:hypothetical protein